MDIHRREGWGSVGARHSPKMDTYHFEHIILKVWFVGRWEVMEGPVGEPFLRTRHGQADSTVFLPCTLSIQCMESERVFSVCSRKTSISNM